MKRGYLVIETCEDYEQVLRLVKGGSLPPGGVLDWAGNNPRTMFKDRDAARKAIERTEHFRLAFDMESDFPEKRFCRIITLDISCLVTEDE